MTTLLVLLMFLLPLEESSQFHTYIVLSEKNNLQINAACEVFPKTLSIGDVIYVKMTIKNISHEASEFVPLRHAYAGRDFRVGAATKSASNTYSEKNNHVRLKPSLGSIDYPVLFRESKATLKTKLLPNSTFVLGVQPLFIPFPDFLDEDFWNSKNFTEETNVMFTFGTLLSDNFITIYQELKIKPRPEAELRLIKEWCDQTKWYNPTVMPEYLWPQDVTSPSPEQWKEFEEKLTAGTFRNYIRMIRSLVEIAQLENKGKRQEQFNEMLKWINELQPLEKEGLTKRAYGIVEKQFSVFGREITIPKDVPDPSK